jgi:pimeloyl-ACP methyl ester carboxylesterase
MTAPLVLVHGAWHDGAGFATFQEELEKLGIPSHTVELTSVATADQPIGDMYRDAELVRKTVDAIGRDCFVLGHSYGGLSLTEGLVGATNVKGLIFLTAFVLDQGETLFAACGSVDPVWWRRNSENTRLTADTPVDVFYNTTPKEIANKAALRLRTQSLEAFNQPIRGVSWKEIDSTYIICEKDNAIPLFAQEAMSQRCTRAVRINTDHSPFLSAPKELAELIKRSLPTLG